MIVALAVLTIGLSGLFQLLASAELSGGHVRDRSRLSLAARSAVEETVGATIGPVDQVTRRLVDKSWDERFRTLALVTTTPRDGGAFHVSARAWKIPVGTKLPPEQPSDVPEGVRWERAEWVVYPKAKALSATAFDPAGDEAAGNPAVTPSATATSESTPEVEPSATPEPASAEPVPAEDGVTP